MEEGPKSGCSVMHDLVAEDRHRPSIPELPQGPIAIVGMAVNMPGAPNTSKLWELLEKGLNMVSEVPENRFRVSDYTTNRYAGRKMKAHTGNFVSDVDKFDHEFFNISPREAQSMDPQIRILLHTAHEALEDSGYVPNASRSFNPETFGCFVGAGGTDYLQNLRNNIDVYYLTGTSRAFISGRLSYAMGFGGPSVVVDTACSSSSVALHHACRALSNGDCNAALAGGVSLITSPDMFIGLDRAHFLSPTGQCKVFDASADGYCRGEGCGIFVLKRLSDALAENDRILGVIRGVEVNQSGTARSITQPHIPTQLRLFQQLFERSGVNPGRVNVVEAHGTGTQCGDVSEIESLRRMFSAGRTAEDPIHVTSIKANIGHLEATSGAASLAKLLLMLQHRSIPRLISLVNLNPKISDPASDYISIDTTSQQPWNPVEAGSPRMALLNNYGATGSNCVLLLEEFVSPDLPKKTYEPSTVSYVFGLSAKTEIALSKMRSRLVDWLDGPDSRNTPLSDISYTLTARRQIYEYRTSLTAHTRQELVKGLQSSPSYSRVSRKDGKVAFVFSGQGGQYFGMGCSLYESVPLFRGIIDQCHSILVSSGFAGVVQAITPNQDGEKLTEVEISEVGQTATFALEYGLSQLWTSWGVTPTLVVGHSLGEYVAQTVAGVLTLRDALILVASRARLMVQKCLPGSTGMMAVNLDAAAIGRALASSSDFSAISIACYNSPNDHVVSGPIDSLQALKSYLDRTIHCKNIILAVEYGYHSSAMRPLQEGLTSLAQRITISPPTIPIISNVFGQVVLPGDASVFNPQYYSRHCIEPVLFDNGIRASVDSPEVPTVDAWIEMGPHATMLPTLKRHPAIQREVLVLTSLRKQEHDLTSLFGALAHLYTSPFEINWRNVFSHMPSLSITSLPAYPWSKTSFWVDFEEGTPPGPEVTPLPGPKTGDVKLPQLTQLVPHSWLASSPSTNDNEYMYKTPISRLSKAICGHRTVSGLPLCPASVFHELVLAGIEASIWSLHGSLDGHSVIMHDIEFTRPLMYTEDTSYLIETTVILDTKDAGSWKVASAAHENEKPHVHGGFRVQPSSSTILKFKTVHPVVSRRVASIISRSENKIFTTSSIYEIFFPRVVKYSKDYHVIQTLTISADNTEGYATIQLPADSLNVQGDRFVLHPVLLDAILQASGFIGNVYANAGDVFICNKLGLVEVIPHLINPSVPYGIYVNCARLPGGNMLADAYMFQPGQTNRIVAHIKGVFFLKVRQVNLERRLALLAAPPVLPDTLPLPEHQVPYNGPQTLGIAPTSPRHGGPAVPNPCAVDSEVSLSGSVLGVRLPNVGDTDVKALLAEVLGLEPSKLPEDANLESLGLDSLASIEAHHVLQSHFGVVLPGNLFDTHVSARAVQTFITGRLPARSKSLDVNGCLGSVSTRRVEDRADPHSVQTAELDVKALLADVLGLEPSKLPEDANLESLGLDSLASIEAHHALQSRFGIVLPSNLFDTHISAKAVQTFIAGRLPARSKSLDANGHLGFGSTRRVVNRADPHSLESIPISVPKTELDVKALLADVLGLEPSKLPEGANLESLGLDSLASIEAHHALQSHFGVVLPGNLFDTHISARAVQTFIAGRLPARSKSLDANEHFGSGSTRRVVNHADPHFLESVPISVQKTELDVKALLADVLGLEPSKLPEDANLEALGLDSLASIEAHHALQSHLGVLLPGNLFDTHISVKAVQTFIAGRLPARPKSLNSNEHLSSGNTRPAAVRTDPAHFLEPIPISVQKAELPGTTPLILIHDGGGRIEYIHRLSSLGRDLWGIYNPNFMNSQPWESVVSMASEYVKYTRDTVGFGPVLLGGWSFGGVAALEVARQLLNSGVVVKGVVLIDSPSPLEVSDVPLSDEFIESIVKPSDAHSASSNRMSLLVQRQFQMNSQILLHYDPAKGSGPYPQVVLLRSREAYCPSGVSEIPKWFYRRGGVADRLSAIAAWEKIVGAPVKCIDLEGNHFQPFQNPYVSTTSSAIAEACSLLDCV